MLVGPNVVGAVDLVLKGHRLYNQTKGFLRLTINHYKIHMQYNSLSLEPWPSLLKCPKRSSYSQMKNSNKSIQWTLNALFVLAIVT